MALKSENLSPPNGVVDTITHKESGNEEDLEDGEIFDEEEMGGCEKTEPRAESARGRRATPPRQRRKRPREQIDNDRKNNKVRRGGREAEKREVDENSLVNMRGGNSPDNQYDRYDSLEEDEIVGGREKVRRGREGFNSNNRVMRRGRISRGQGLKRRPPPSRNKMDYSICKFYMQGKCQRGSECPFSHAALPPRKLELCKFYMMDCCAKKDKCLFMHAEFPCKYYHTGLKCYAGKRCKFSHAKLTPQLRNALHMHLESTGKEMEFGGGRGGHNKRGGRDDEHHHHHHGGGGHHGGHHGGGGHHHHGGRHLDGPIEDEGPDEEWYQDEPDQDDPNIPSLFELRLPPPEHEGQTPMPSPPPPLQDNSDSRDSESRLKRERRESGGSMDGEEGIPAHLPKKQRELYLRIHHQQRTHQPTPSEREDESRDEEWREENWYSSDEEAPNTLATIINNINTKAVLPDIDVSAVSKLLCSVRETIQQKIETGSPTQGKAQPPNTVEEKRRRDPRLERDVDLRQLPFKPAPNHMAATEIDASLSSHPPIDYRLTPFSTNKPDYSNIKPQPKNVNDPRLKRYNKSGGGGGAGSVAAAPPSRDPRAVAKVGGLLAGDPRRKSVLLKGRPEDSDLRFSQPPSFPFPPPPSHHTDTDLRHFPYNP